MKQFTRIAFAVAALTLVAGCSRQVNVKFGFVGPISGPLAEIGKDMLHGAEIAVEELNRDGFIIDGKRAHFELVVEDDGSDAEKGKAAVKRLIDAGIVGAIGHFNSGVAIPTSAQFAAAGVPEFSLATNPKYTRMGNKTAFRILADDVEQGGALARLAIDKFKAKTPFIVDDQTTFGTGIAEEMGKVFKNKNIQIPRESIAKAADPAKADYSELVKKIIANNTDVLLYGGTEEAGIPFLKALRAAGSQAKFVGGDGMCAPSIVKSGGGAADNNFYCSIPGTPAAWLSQGINFTQMYKQKFGEPGGQSALTYESIHVMAQAMERARSTDPKAYLPELTKGPFDGKVQGAVEFDQKGDIKDGTVAIYQTSNGTLSEQRALTQ